MASSGYRFGAGLTGSKVITVGADADIFNFTSLAEAVLAADSGAVIMLEPITYTLTSTLTINKPLTFKSFGVAANTKITSALTTKTVIVNVPASSSAAVTINFENITFDNSSAAAGDAVQIDNNGGAAVDLAVNFNMCSFTLSGAGSGYGLNSVHTTGTKDINITVSGSPLIHTMTTSYVENKKALSSLSINGMYLNGGTNGIVVPAGNAVASTLNIFNSLVIGAAVTTGGNAANITNYGGNLKTTSGLKAAIGLTAAGDFDALGTESPMGYAAI